MTLIYPLLYFLFAVLFFQLVQRPAFFLTHAAAAARRTDASSSLSLIWSRGLRTDLVAAAYLTALPLIAAWIGSYCSGFPFEGFMRVYNIVAATLAGLACGFDLVLYRFWKSKLDASALGYLKTMEGVMASVSVWFALGALAICAAFGIVFWLGSYGVAAIVEAIHPQAVGGLWAIAGVSLGGLLMAALLFAAIRGLNRRPNTPAVSFFSTDMLLNHCAVNPFYNFIYSLSSAKNPSSKFTPYPAEECREKARRLFPTAGTPQQQLLTTDRPNIVLVIWESLSARHAGMLGAPAHITPRLNAIAADGLTFSRCDAGSIRTDRGLMCLLSGYLCPPATNLVKYTRKLPNLPSLPRTLSRAGYHTEVLHGGDLSFYHMGSYYMAIGLDRLRGIEAFAAEQCRGKWGVHDGPMFGQLLRTIEELEAENRRPWMAVLQTLSSHEDFAVPYSRLSSPIDNAFAYTDHCLGEFIDSLQTMPAWDNTLVIITGDHGFYHGEAIERNRYPHIPVILAGGALARKGVVDTVMSQTDIAATLLGQLGLDHSDFIFSRDVLADTYRTPFSFHTHQTGMQVRDERGYTEYDMAAQAAIDGSDPQREEIALTALQRLYDDLSTR